MEINSNYTFSPEETLKWLDTITTDYRGKTVDVPGEHRGLISLRAPHNTIIETYLNKFLIYFKATKSEFGYNTVYREDGSKVDTLFFAISNLKLKIHSRGIEANFTLKVDDPYALATYSQNNNIKLYFSFKSLAQSNKSHKKERRLISNYSEYYAGRFEFDAIASLHVIKFCSEASVPIKWSY